MSAPVNVTARERRRFVDVAQAAWGEATPDWVRILAEEVDRTTQTATAKRLGYSSSVVSQTLGKSYAGDLSSVEQAVRGALMGATVECPVLGEIGRDMCLDEQRMPAAATSAMRMQLWRACRAGCPHSKFRSEA